MDSVFSRTSVTVDEAVAILLGLTEGPILFQRSGDESSPEQQEAFDSLAFSIHDLDEELEWLKSDLAEAIFDKLDSRVIAAKREAVQKQQDEIDHANTYFSAVEDELNNGVTSALRVDATRSNHRPYITLSSLDEWAKSKGYGVQVLVAVTTAMLPEAELPKISENKVRRKQRDQEKAIIEEIKRLGHNPLELPINKSGHPGVKAEVRNALQASQLFKGNSTGEKSTVFNKAWERLRYTKDIVEK
jgi:phosphoglycerate-specific signal transduction histidine kinase